MAVDRSDLSEEEWEALQRLNRGAPEADLIPPLMRHLLLELGLALERPSRIVISDRGKKLIRLHRDGRR
ncbi:hypothetical protein IMF23_07785 [Chelatococcus daeguensis]|uniref:hypothetical protein n=1 Tax=Chelatococcus daeguensis TaxID=444444 RepID=UPI0007AB3559|nr:hypothetical protein [Chelatococcus daeguensis]KZE28384.1 hypothetical protein AVW15_06145 [Chelatococcus daeguensis]MBM3083331.1 hypothetical protein [Chelatococcus daeguensis]